MFKIKKDECYIEDLDIGETFEYHNEYYIVTDIDKAGVTTAVDFNGYTEDFNDDHSVKVTKVDFEVKIV